MSGGILLAACHYELVYYIHTCVVQSAYIYVCDRRTADQLILESGCMFEHPAAAEFRHHVLDGDWDKVISNLSLLSLTTLVAQWCSG